MAKTSCIVRSAELHCAESPAPRRRILPAMDPEFTVQKLLTYRKLTRAIGEIVSAQAKEYIAALTPLFRQRAIFGEHIQGAGKEAVNTADRAFKELQTLYASVAGAAPFQLSKELQSPLMQMTSSLELSPWEYVHEAKTSSTTKTITVTSPFKWIVSFAGYTPRRIRDLLAHRDRDHGALQQAVLHHLAMHIIVANQPGLKQLLETLRFPIGSTQLPGLGNLPITYISSAVSTTLPPDDVVIDSTELSGKDAFEELVNVKDIEGLRDPHKERLMEAVQRGG